MLNTNNPTAKQSQEWIIRELLGLMETKNYDKISVSEICRKADIDRRTFYRNFNSKNDVLEQYINILRQEYLSNYSDEDGASSYKAAKYFFEFWNRHLCFIKSIKNNGLSDYVFHLFTSFSKEHNEFLIGDFQPDMQLEYIYAYRIGGFWNVLLTLADKENKPTPDELALILSQT